MARLIAALTGALAAVLVSAAVANAGTYTIYACGGPAGGTNDIFRPVSDDPQAAAYQSCPPDPNAVATNQYWATGLVTRTVWSAGSVGSLRGSYQMLDAPPGATVAALHADMNVWEGYSGSQYWSLSIVGYGYDWDRSLNANAARVWGCAATGAFCYTFGTQRVDVAVGKPSVRIETRCGAPNFGSCATYGSGTSNPTAWATAANVAVDISDSSGPSISSVGGGLSTGAWLRGSQRISFNASDNVGIKSARLAVDGVERANWANSCVYTALKPCGDLNGGYFDLGTASLSDGAHSLAVSVSDSAGNVSTWSRTIYTDNSAPRQPSVSVSSAWTNVNSFSAVVANAAGQAAPVVRAWWRICDAYGQNCGAATSAGVGNGGDGGQTTLSGITLPQDGDYTLRVYEEDAAGNVDISALSAPVHLRLDRVAPEAPTSVVVDGGEDWRPTNAFRLSWTNPAGQLAPIARAYIVECDAQGSCATSSQSAQDIAQASGVTVPAKGDYATAVYLEDEAGNAVAANASSAVHLRFDDTVPAEPRLERKNGWLNATDALAYGQQVTYPIDRTIYPVGPSGIHGYSVSYDGSDPDLVEDVAADRTQANYPATATLTGLPEGTITVRARAITGAGVAGTTFDAAELKVDETPPTASESGAPDPANWQTSAVSFTVSGADALSGMVAAAPGADVTTGGYMEYAIDGGQPTRAAGATATVSLSADGVHTVTYRAYDVAGNASGERSVKLRIDSTAPDGAFEAIDANDPRRISALVTDATSGVAGGVIQIRAAAGGQWRDLDTTLANGRLSAYIADDAQMPDGIYDLRARVRDHAGNVGIIDRRVDGSRMELAFPLRGPTVLVASGRTVRTTLCRLARYRTRAGSGRIVRKKRRVCRKVRVPSAKRGKRITLRPRRSRKQYVFGQLKDRVGNPIRNAAIVVSEQPRSGGTAAERARLATNALGTLRYEVRRDGPSRTIRLAFEGTNTLKPSSAEVRVARTAKTTIRVSRRSVRQKSSVVFRGRLAGGYVPRSGKLVDLQVFFRGKWRTFGVPRAKARGTWRFRYRFGATYVRPVTYRFRALVPFERAYPFEPGRSPTVRVQVRP